MKWDKQISTIRLRDETQLHLPFFDLDIMILVYLKEINRNASPNTNPTTS